MNQVSLDLNYLKSIKPHFEILCYGSKIFTNYFTSMIQWTEVARHYGIQWSYNIIANESLVTRARNIAVANFLTQEQATHLIFIDVDQGFNPQEILVLLNHKKDLIVAPVPMKVIPLMYNINPMPGAVTDNNTGLLKLARAGTGCMVIKRETLENLKSHPDVHPYKDDLVWHTGGEIDPQHHYTYFNTSVKTDEVGNTRFMSEDFDFCEKLKDQGIDLWCDTRLTLTHMGVFNYGAEDIAIVTNRIKERLNSTENEKNAK